MLTSALKKTGCIEMLQKQRNKATPKRNLLIVWRDPKLPTLKTVIEVAVPDKENIDPISVV